MAKFTKMLKQGMEFLAQNEDKMSSTISQAKTLAEKNIGKGKVTTALDKVEQGIHSLKKNKDLANSALGILSSPKSAKISTVASLASNLAFSTNAPKDDIEEQATVTENAGENNQAILCARKEITVDVTDPEDNYFEATLEKLNNAADINAMTSPQAAMQALNTLSECAQETVRYCASQETKREEIRAQRDCVIAKINAVSALLKDYLDKTFDERSLIFAEQFKALDRAMSTDNTEAIGMVLNSINSLASQSPFKNLADINQVQQSLGEGSEWDI